MTTAGPPASVTTIIPTMATRERAPALRRAVESIRRSSTEAVEIIVVVNGARSDAELCEWLRSQPDVHFEYVAQPSAPNAVLRGRELVRTPFFSTLDDDDEYLDGALDIRLAAIESAPDVDVVVTNGYLHCAGTDARYYDDLAQVPHDPLASLFASNWLHNCNTLFRSATIGREYFADFHPFVEWTWLAFRLAMAG
jgi:glycosyltransferase involved in cell wall biosynthesis